MSDLLEDLLAQVKGADPGALREIEEEVSRYLPGKFVPNPGPQTDAWFCKADVLLYGGEAGGGKSGLLCGLALEEHHQSLIMRRHGVDLEGGGGLINELLRLNGSRDGFSGKPPPTLTLPSGQVITFGAAANLGDEQKYIGRARDFLGLDEASQFHEQQVRLLMGWLRTIKKGQRTRAVFATNPPIDSTGDWIIGMFRPWLDDTHHNPAKHGELRWYITVREATGTVDIEVDGPEPVEMDGQTVIPTSRTFIPAKLKDNPYIITRDYQKQLDALPEPYRSAYRDGNFMAARQDHMNQLIPTEWIRQAQERWTPEPPEHAPMSCLAVDPAQGGADETAIAMRYDNWFAPLDITPGIETPTGNEIAGLVVSKRRHDATVVVDMGGGYGGSTAMRLEDNGLKVIEHKGANRSVARTANGAYPFANKRSEIYYRLYEALDPAQDGGATIALPPDPVLVSDLTALHRKITAHGIQVTPKDKLVEQLGRSPDRGDAVAMCNAYGPVVATHGRIWRKFSKSHGPKSGGPSISRSHEAARRHLRK